VIPWLFLLLDAPPLDRSYTYPPVTSDAPTLTVSVSPGTGPPHVYYALTVAGSPSLEVEAPQLSDLAGAWSVRRSAAWRLVGDRAEWTEVLVLDQIKPGVLPLPDVKLLYRDKPSAAWQMAEWNEILHEIRELPAPSPPVPPLSSEWRASWWVVPAAAIIVLALIAAVLVRRRRAPAPLSPHQMAVRELDRLEGSVAVDGQDPRIFFAQLSDLLRRYLTQRYGLPALQLTTAELQRRVCASDRLATEATPLRDILEECDLAKFARVESSVSRWRQTAALAREFLTRSEVVASAPVVPTTPVVANGHPGESDHDSSSRTN
jgi:hypothetical protein